MKTSALHVLISFIIYGNLTAQTNTSLVLRYQFNNTVADISSNSNNPSFNNTTFTTDRFGNANSAVHFNGANSFIQIPNNLSLNFANTITLSAWVRPTGFYYDICHASSILNKGTADYLPGNYSLRFDDALFTEGKGCSGDRLKDSLHMNFRATGTPLKTYTPFIEKNKWYHLVYTNDGSTATLYVDCDIKYAVPFKETFTNTEDLFLGKTNDEFFPFWFNGDLDDVRIYNRALSKTEVEQLCAEETKKPELLKPAPVIEKRTNELVRQIMVDNDSVSVSLYDNGEIDGDSVTLIYNNNIITTHQLLTAQAKTFVLKVEPGNAKNELVMYAENLGSIPPNTALMIITDGNKRYEVNVRSSKYSNGVVAFKPRE
jgi:Concanavalin A-like lectin/glucanases superfamily